MRNKKCWVISVVLVMVLLALNFSAFAFDTELERATLRGHKGFFVIVDLPSTMESAGLSKMQVQTAVELKLRMAGIKVLTMDECFRTLGRPTLYLRVHSIEILESSIYSFAMCIDFYQHVYLAKNPKTESFANTWSYMLVGFVGKPKIRELINFVENASDVFINAYLSVNPKQ